MRKITVLAFITLDGVKQAPGGPEEDTSNGFKYGGWTAPLSDESSDTTMQKEMEPADLLLGRKTFEIFSNYWPSHAQYWPGVNDVAKYALSNTLKDSDNLVTQWNNSKVLNSVDDIKALKNSPGANIKVWGSSELVKLLLEHDLVDEFWLNTYPVILGKGKKLFGDTAMPAAFKLADSFVTGTGVFMANYHRNGDVQTGSFNE